MRAQQASASSRLWMHAASYASGGMTPPQSSKAMATPEPDQGSVGTPAACAMMVEPTWPTAFGTQSSTVSASRLNIRASPLCGAFDAGSRPVIPDVTTHSKSWQEHATSAALKVTARRACKLRLGLKLVRSRVLVGVDTQRQGQGQVQRQCTLSPRAAMAAAGGPRKRILDAVSASAAGSSGFSEAWPLPASNHGYGRAHYVVRRRLAAQSGGGGIEDEQANAVCRPNDLITTGTTAARQLGMRRRPTIPARRRQRLPAPRPAR